MTQLCVHHDMTAVYNVTWPGPSHEAKYQCVVFNTTRYKCLPVYNMVQVIQLCIQHVQLCIQVTTWYQCIQHAQLCIYIATWYQRVQLCKQVATWYQCMQHDTPVSTPLQGTTRDIHCTMSRCCAHSTPCVLCTIYATVYIIWQLCLYSTTQLPVCTQQHILIPVCTLHIMPVCTQHTQSVWHVLHNTMYVQYYTTLYGFLACETCRKCLRAGIWCVSCILTSLH